MQGPSFLPLFFALLFSCSRAQDQPSDRCENFVQTENKTTKFHDKHSYRISPGFTCDEAHQTEGTVGCYLDAGGYLELPRLNNLTERYDAASGGSADFLPYTDKVASGAEYTIYNLTSGPNGGQSSQFGSVGNSSYMIKMNQSAYVSFTPNFQCVSGRLENCPVELYLLEGLYAQVCEAQFREKEPDNSYGLRFIYGWPQVEEINQTYAATLTDNPAAKVPEEVLNGSVGPVTLSGPLGIVVGVAMLWLLL
ncbi:hypothetical protein KC340_g1066 [Hortaea werneckii]|nr:hypothetical protein KC342_g4922 [Hortaea werneckii]KAI7107535.1 hypothetical protein KC339_g2308 [Hortaea werneckii]KAI7244522.1 hypothetical protein KC365_g1327 [Hortaea werneckii]KAI7338132.1 hypothetical protein KC340_g1066 [Hortaea werneckii]KAI7377496.1 hypothetical protein KC328_g14392 [Hortaea werneckii]